MAYHLCVRSEALPANQAMCCHIDASLGQTPQSTWNRRPGHPCNSWLEQICQDSDSSADLWHRAIKQAYRRENITEQMFRQIKCPTHPLHSLLPLLKVPQINLRSSYPYTVPIFKKSRYGRDIIPYCISKK